MLEFDVLSSFLWQRAPCGSVRGSVWHTAHCVSAVTGSSHKMRHSEREAGSPEGEQSASSWWDQELHGEEALVPLVAGHRAEDVTPVEFAYLCARPPFPSPVLIKEKQPPKKEQSNSSSSMHTHTPVPELYLHHVVLKTPQEELPTASAKIS